MQWAVLAATPFMDTQDATFVPDWTKSGIFFKNRKFRAFLTAVDALPDVISSLMASDVPFWQVSPEAPEPSSVGLLGRPVNIPLEPPTECSQEIGGSIRVIKRNPLLLP